jgi:ribosome maturation factor RimP
MRGIRLPVGAGAPISPPSSSGSRDEPKKKSGPKTRSFCLPPAPWATTSKTWPQVTELLRRIEEIVAPTVVGMGYELVRVAMSRGGGTLQIMIEPADGRAMDVEDCATVSRALSAVLDVEDPIPSAYTLEVSSPGIDRPLTRPKDYARWAGHIARVEIAQPIEGQRRFKGTLLGLEEDTVKLRLDDGKEAHLPLAAVTRAKLEMTDRLVEEHRRAQDGANHAH